MLLIPFAVAGCDIEQVSPVLYRGPDINDKRLRELKLLGIKTIVNIRLNPQNRERLLAQESGLNYFHIPTGVFLVPDNEKLKKFLEIVRNPKYQPVYISCYIGNDRTALFVGLYRIAEQGWSYKDTYKEMREHDLKEWWYAFRNYKKVLKQYADNPALAGPQSQPTEPKPTALEPLALETAK